MKSVRLPVLATCVLFVLSICSWDNVYSSDYSEQVTQDSPIGYWRLQETDPNAPAVDETTNNRPLTYNNFTEDSFGRPGPFINEAAFAPSFRTAEQRTVSAADSNDFAFTAGQSFSYEFWLRTEPGANVNGVGVVVKGYTTTSQVLPWYLSRLASADGSTEFFTRNSGSESQQALGVSDVSDGQWHQITAVYDASAAENRIYVDGVLDAVKTDVPEDDYGTNSEVFTIGRHFNRFYEGQIAEMSIYDSALSEERIQAHFAEAITTPDLRGDFDFDGVLTTADFDIMADNFVTGLFYSQGDFNQDVAVDLRDFVAFSAAFDAAGAAGATVPEPSSMLLASLGIISLISIRRRFK